MSAKRILLYIFLLLGVKVFSQPLPKVIYAQKGVLDLRQWNPDSADVIELAGEWEFYWHRLLTPQDFHPQRYVADAYLWVPAYWSENKHGKKFPALGYGTYRLVILTSKKYNKIRLYVPSVNTSMKVWFNGKLLGHSGVVGTSADKSKASVDYVLREVTLDSVKNELIIQVSNYFHREGGFFRSPMLGTIGGMKKELGLWLFFDIFLFGAAIIMALYHLGIFLMRPKQWASFAFFVFALLMALRVFITNPIFETILFPKISFGTSLRLEYITFFWIAPFLNFYLYQVVKDKVSFYFSFYTLVLAFLFSITLFFSTLFFSKMMLPYNILVYVPTVIMDLYILIKHLRLKTEGVGILFFAYLIIVGAIVNDMLLFLRIINSVQLAPLGVFVLLLAQALALARRFSKAFSENEYLLKELEFKNVHLEELVKQRTSEIEKQKNELARQNELLKEQSEKLKLKDEMITESLEYAATLLRAIYPPLDNLKKYFDVFVLFKPKDIVSGDGYWIYENDSYIFISLYDCTGHGVPAAFLNILANILLTTTVRDKQIFEPNRVLEYIDKELKEILSRVGNDGMEMIIMRVDKGEEEPKIKVASAKIELFYYNSRTGLVTRYRGTRRALGYASASRNKEVFSNYLLTFKKGDVIYILSDGYIDQGNKKHERFGTDRFMELIRKIGNMPVEEQHRILSETIVEFMEDTIQRDDILVLGIKNKVTQSKN